MTDIEIAQAHEMKPITEIAAAAGNYRREGDTTVNQYIYSKAQTAADLARETRWEADRAKGHKR